MHPELKAWRERNGRDNRIGDVDPETGKLPDWAVKSFRERHPDRTGEYTTPPPGFSRIGGHLSGGRFDSMGWWIPHRIS
jgi:hypothetical protein